jgi:cell division transport system ATP-binding protein
MITFQALGATVAYDAMPALTNVSCVFDGSGIYVITGPTGAGKTTLLRMLYADLLPTSGDVLIDGFSTRTMRAKQVRVVRRGMGIVQQNAQLIADRTAYDNVTLPLAARGMSRAEANKRCLEVLADLNVSYIRHKLGSQLSGGERHLVALARALVTRPSVIIADEPTGTLDPATTQMVASALRAQAEAGNMVIVSTHSESLLAALPTANRVVVEDGTVA